MKNFELKKYFGNLVGMPTSMKQSVSKPMFSKGGVRFKIGKEDNANLSLIG